MSDVGIQFQILKGLIRTGRVNCTIVIDGVAKDVILSVWGYDPSKCFMCGHSEMNEVSGNNVSHHHVLNKAWHPKKNFKIPMCKHCHDFVHSELPNNLVPFQRNSVKRLRYALQHNRTTIDSLVKRIIDECNTGSFNAKDLLNYKLYEEEIIW